MTIGKRSGVRVRGRLLAVLAIALAAGCGDDDGTTTETPIVSVSGNYSVALGDTLQLSASTRNGTDSSYTWASDDDTVATVDSSGLVTSVAAGETEITATGATTGADGVHGVVVTTAGAPSVTVEGDFSVLVGGTTELTATTVNGQDGTYTWASSDDLIATVDAAGVVNGLAPGEVTITATGDDSAAEGAIGIVVAMDIPNYDKWLGSAHARRADEPFHHWDAEDPPEIPTDCARCHSTPGFQDYIGADGSDPFVVDAPAPIGTVIECQACHNDAASKLSQVTFPSGVTIEGLGPEARCMTCHQGRSSTDDVDAYIAAASPVDDDTVNSGLTFQNIHYYAAGATLNAGRVRGGYQYAGQTYDWRFRHAPGRDTCVGCHDPHSLQRRLTVCATCHTGVTTDADVKDIRMMASLNQDYDGDGDTTEGLYYEIDGLRGSLLEGIQAYATEGGLNDVCYNGAVYPYWFKDTDGDGTCSAEESAFPNAFAEWTPRLVRASYNYQVSIKDPGAFAHNGKYIIQLLYDSLADLDTTLSDPIDMTDMVRNDFGHFNGAGQPARHWDAEEGVSADCSRCHGGSEGFRFYLQYGVGKTVEEQDNGLDCATCHDDLSSTFDLVSVAAVKYPSGKTYNLANTDPSTNMCGTCHAGRQSKSTVDASIASGGTRMVNMHYLAAGATLAGSNAAGGYEYTGKTYAGRYVHPGPKDCAGCHAPVATNHSFRIEDNITLCMGCHNPIADARDIRGFTRTEDTDGDGNVTEGSAEELDGLNELLLDEIKGYAAGTATGAICYSNDNPYFMKDTNANGTCDAGEATRYDPMDAKLIKATFNYQYIHKEPGAFAHNFDYAGQLLYDSIEDLGGPSAVVGLARP